MAGMPPALDGTPPAREGTPDARLGMGGDRAGTLGAVAAAEETGMAGEGILPEGLREAGFAGIAGGAVEFSSGMVEGEIEKLLDDSRVRRAGILSVLLAE